MSSRSFIKLCVAATVAATGVLAIAAPAPASAQTCLGTNVEDIERDAVDWGLEATDSDVVLGSKYLTGIVVDTDISGRDRSQKSFAHTVLHATRTETGADLTLDVYISTEVKNMCPAVDIIGKGAYQMLKRETKSDTPDLGGRWTFEKARDDYAGTTSAPDYDKLDHILITLRQGSRAFPLALVKPTAADNHIRLTASVTVKQLKKLLKKPTMEDEAFKQAYNLWTIGSEWMGVTTTSSEARNVALHWTGVGNKAPTANFTLADPTTDEIDELDNAPMFDWHGGGKLGAGGLYETLRRRLLSDTTFGSVLSADGQLNTSLEAESEYQIDEAQYKAFKTLLDGLAAFDPKNATESELDQLMLGILTDTNIDHVTADKNTKTEDGSKTATDIYYDRPTSKYPLLDSGLYLRRRKVVGDDDDFFLLIHKGEFKINDGLMIRIGTQVEMTGVDIANSVVSAFVRDSKWNPFSRIFTASLKKIGEPRGGNFVPALEVTSKRFKYIIHLREPAGMSIDITLDDATAKSLIDKRVATTPYYAIEFGLAHPGRNIVAQMQEIGREFHHYGDLDGERIDHMMEREDTQAFLDARDLTLEFLNLAGDQTPITASKNNGGFKATVLFHALK